MVTLSLLCQGDFNKGGASEIVSQSSKRNQLRLRRVKFECNYAEMQHFHFKVKQACNAVKLIVTPPKEKK